jgi:hypothetical protein
MPVFLTTPAEADQWLEADTPMRWRCNGRCPSMSCESLRNKTRRRVRAVIRIAITPAAFETMAATLPLGSVGFEREADAKDERMVWLEAAVVDRLAALCGPGESCSDVISLEAP